MEIIAHNSFNTYYKRLLENVVRSIHLKHDIPIFPFKDIFHLQKKSHKIWNV